VSLTTFSSLSAETNLVTNGDFETGTGKTFEETSGWYNRGRGANQKANARSTGFAHGGSCSALVSDRYDNAKSAFLGAAHCQKTSYAIKAGDSFVVSYFWRPVDSGWQLGRDNIEFALFATDNNTVGGTVVWSALLRSENFSGLDLADWKNVSDQSTVATAAAVGKTLFVCFYGVDRGKILSKDTGYALVDDIEVTAMTAASRPH
jgi:hypothetical protein